MQIKSSFPLVDEIVLPFSAAIGGDLPGYRNHIYRALNYFAVLSNCGKSLPESVLIAAAFHDIGIWTDRTFDYLEPSARRARAYLAARNLQQLAPEIDALIAEHHRIRRYRREFAVTVETYRQADLVDLSLGLIRFGLPRSLVRTVKSAFPNAGFHRRLAALAGKQLLRSPLRPLPMIHW